MSTLEARKAAMLARHKQELEELEALQEQEVHLSSLAKRCRNCTNGGILPQLPDSVLLHICRILAPVSCTDSAKDLLSLEVVSYDLSLFLRRSSHKALYPLLKHWKFPQMDIRQLDAKEQFFHMNAIRNVMKVQNCKNQKSTLSCFRKELITPSREKWIQDLISTYPQPNYFPSASVVKLKVTEHSINVILEAVEPTLIRLLQNASSASVHRSMRGTQMRRDQVFSVTEEDITLAQTIEYRELCCGYMTCPQDKILVSRLTLPQSTVDLSACVREMGYRAGVPRLAPSALKMVAELANQMTWTVIKKACIVVEHACMINRIRDSLEGCEVGGKEIVWTYPEPCAYPTSTVSVDKCADLKICVTLGVDAVEYACEQLGYNTIYKHQGAELNEDDEIVNEYPTEASTTGH